MERSNKGIATLLFAILLQLCSTGLELLTLGIGIIGLIMTIQDDNKVKNIKQKYNEWNRHNNQF